MRRVEQQVIEQSHPQFRLIDQMAFASKNLWNLANYQVRQSFGSPTCNRGGKHLTNQ
jgi:putative transposase